MNRLALARWLTDGQHPLTARVLVNRLWEQLFGVGIVKSSENLGVQTDWPSHPQLLDWLAVDFVEHGWNIKRLLRQMLMSAAYRQDAATNSERLVGPGNRLLSRGPRTRLAAEMVRDQALFLSGLMVEKHGGPSMGFISQLACGARSRSAAHSSRITARNCTGAASTRASVVPSRIPACCCSTRRAARCTVKRSHTNTPLQALALMNEVTYVEASRKFAERIIANGVTPGERIAWAFRAATARQPEPTELRC